MSQPRFVLSGFGDEIAAEPEAQLYVLTGLGIRHLDLRGAWERPILDFSDRDVARLAALLDARGARVSLIASPIGKSSIEQEAELELGRLERALRLAAAFGTDLVRIFSFYHEGLDHAACRDEVLRRLARFADAAARVRVTLLLENEVNLWGDTPERCRELLDTIDSPRLRLSLDTGNFAAIGVRSHDEAYAALRPYVVHVQIKDVRHADGTVTVPGEGDGQIPELLRALADHGYRGYLALEPHLALAGKRGGFSGPELFSRAAEALRRLIGEMAPDAAVS